MKFIMMFPEFQNKSDSELIETIPLDVVIPILNEVGNYYNERLKMGRVYSVFGHELEDGSDQQQVQCLLPQHGTDDRHPSSRFYSTDRNTGEETHAVYCFKCQRVATPFWLVYLRKTEEGMKNR